MKTCDLGKGPAIAIRDAYAISDYSRSRMDSSNRE